MKLGNNKCVFCIPIVAVTCGELGKQAGSVLREHPDFAEWRGDYLNSCEDLSRASEIVKGLKDSGAGIRFTPRSIEEGGARTLTGARRRGLSESGVGNGWLGIDKRKMGGVGKIGETAHRVGMKMRNDDGLHIGCRNPTCRQLARGSFFWAQIDGGQLAIQAGRKAARLREEAFTVAGIK